MLDYITIDNYTTSVLTAIWTLRGSNALSLVEIQHEIKSLQNISFFLVKGS